MLILDPDGGLDKVAVEGTLLKDPVELEDGTRGIDFEDVDLCMAGEVMMSSSKSSSSDEDICSEIWTCVVW
jgi:hypothetical protein